jgi:hypothetical protein
MTASIAPRNLLRAFALRETEAAHTLNEQLPDSQRDEYFDLVAALFAVLLERRFANGVSRDAISSFVSEMRYDYRSAQPPFNSLAAEGVIRAAFGDDHLLADLPNAEVLNVQHQVITKIVAQDSEVSAALDRFLDEAEATASAWRAEDA